MGQSTVKNAYTLNDVKIYVDEDIIGMVQTCKVEVKVTEQVLYEAGNQGLPVARVFTKKEITGSFERVLVDKAILAKLWPTTEGNPIEFTLKGIADDNVKHGDRDFLVSNCAINTFSVDLDLESETKQDIPFTAFNFKWLN